MNFRKTLIASALFSASVVTSAFAGDFDINKTVTGLAMRGYDPVSYFTEGAPAEGDFQITSVYDGATYRFVSEDHKTAFEADPESYVPAYGGFCAFGTAMGVKVDGDPELWSIVDDRLYLNLSEPVQERWVADQAGFIEKADVNWTEIEDSDPAALNQ